MVDYRSCAGRKAEDLACFGGGCDLPAEFLCNADCFFNKLAVALCKNALFKVDVVFKADADVAAEKNAEGDHREFGSADARNREG